MKALMLSGGSGTRLRPITHTAAKQLVPIANKPILFYGLESLAAAGIAEVGVVVGRTKDEVMEAVGDGSAFDLKVTYIDQGDPRGLADTVLISREFLGGDDFVMYLGDNFLLGGINDVVERFRNRGSSENAHILLARVPDPSRFGVAIMDGEGKVTGLLEKPVEPPSDLALVGVYLFDPTIHDAVRAIEPSARGELEITDAIGHLIKTGKNVGASMVDGYWKDLGEPEALLEGNRMALERLTTMIAGKVTDSKIEGTVVIEAGALVVDSVIRGPAIVGAGTVVRSSYVGPFSSIGRYCRIEETEVANSIVLDNAVVSQIAELEASIIGRYAQVLKRANRPISNSIVVGDHSRLELI